MESTYQKIVAQNISKLRKETGLFELAFATEAGIDPKTLRAAERADGNLELGTLDKIAKAFDIPATQLFEGIPDASSWLASLADLLSGDHE